MNEDIKKPLHKVVQIDEKRIQDHLGELVRGSVNVIVMATDRSLWRLVLPHIQLLIR